MNPDKKYLLEKSKYFCMSAWTHLHALPDGKVISCCLSPMNEPLGYTHQEPINQIWNGVRMCELRRNMLADQPTNSICSRCYEKEDNGLSSLRNGMNTQYGEKFFHVVENTWENGRADFNLVHWDFRFSNICNLKCRTCGPAFSSSWNDDYRELHHSNTPKEEFQQSYPKFMRMINDEENFWKVMTPLFDTVEAIHFAGGEPLIMDEHYRIMKELLKRDQFHTRLRYSTNLSRLSYKGDDVLPMWENFKDIDLSLSIDAYGARFDYLRSGGSWEQTLANLERLRDARDAGKLNGVRWLFHPTISTLNVFHILDLHRYLLDNGHIVPDRFFETSAHYMGDFVLNPVIYPNHYNIQCLPETVKAQVRIVYQKHAEWALTNYNIPPEGLLSVITHMDKEDKTEHFQTFLDITNRLDSLRREDFNVTFPELSNLTKQWNF